MKPRARVDVPSCPNRGLNGTRPSLPNVVMFNFILLEICRLIMIMMMVMMMTIIIIIIIIIIIQCNVCVFTC